MLRRGEGFGRLGIGVPFYKPSYEFFRWWTWLVAGGFESGDVLLNGPDVPGEVAIPVAHNAIVRAFLKTDCDTLCIVEDDHVGEQDVVRRLRDRGENWDYDIVCANYSKRSSDLELVGVAFTGEVSDYGEAECRIDPMAAWETGTQPVDCAALGLVLIRRWVLEAMLGDQEPGDYHWFDWRGHNSQDVQFYWRARAVGARVAVDRDAQIGHVGKAIYWPKHFYRRRAAATEGNDG